MNRQRLIQGLVVIPIILWAVQTFMHEPLFQFQFDLLAKTEDLDGTFDAVLVLGYSVSHKHNKPSKPLIERLKHAHELVCDESRASTLIMSGGSSWEVRPEYPTESEVMFSWMEKYLDEAGCGYVAPVPAGQVFNYTNDIDGMYYREVTLPTSGQKLKFLLEHRSTSTLTNAVNTLDYLERVLSSRERDDERSEDENNISKSAYRIVLITNGFHQYRTTLVFQKAAATRFPNVNFEFYSDPPKNIDHTKQWNFWRELLAIALYAFMGWI